ncbi:Mdh3 [Kluyveromyces lactis]|nr:Mdh3 [Kluyveromyces lactis]
MVSVTVLGSSGGIGQPLSLLLKLDPHVSSLRLYDLKLSHGNATDLSHIDTNSTSEGFNTAEIGQALKGAQLVIIPAGIPRKPGMSRDDLFKINAKIIKSLTVQIAEHAPDARILVISNPVNSLVPIVYETLQSMGKFQAGKVMGITTLDIIRSHTFLVDIIGRKAYSVEKLKDAVTVVGGHSGETIIPIFTDQKFYRRLRDSNVYESYVHRVQFGGDEVVKAKDGSGSATLSMAWAGYTFAKKLLNSLHLNTAGDQHPIPTFVYLPGLPGGKELQKKLNTSVEFFSAPVKLEKGIVVAVEHDWVDKLNDDEKKLIAKCLPILEKNIKKGLAFSKQTKL